MAGLSPGLVLMAATAKWRYYPGQSWFFQRKAKQSKRKTLRKRDGDDCWYCGNVMRFGGIPNTRKSATIEHLQPLTKGGTWALDNLALCHSSCNGHLKDFDRTHKEMMRDNMAAGRKKNETP
ncbi:MAG: HNH endonuclease signature motif containing protein [Parasphingorhabdus sp.]|uniref:HNH endonuclease n=1 Tax=Parasphingorhabdus sp. TaxID=2709688 RepID=UPI0032975D4A